MRNVDTITVARDLEREATRIAAVAHSIAHRLGGIADQLDPDDTRGSFTALADSCARQLVDLADQLDPSNVQLQEAIAEVCAMLTELRQRIGPQ